MKIGIALAGGGMKGVAHIGALKAFEELGIKFDCISGTSSGSLAAVLYSMGYTCEELKHIICSSYKQLVKIDKKPILSSIGTYFAGKKFSIKGLIPGERVEKIVSEIVSKKNYKNISEIKIPLAIAVVDTISAKECLILSQEGNAQRDNIDYLYDMPICTAVRSSMSFPGIFTPNKYRSYNFIDGGAKDNIPIGALKDMGADLTIGLSFKMDSYNMKNENVFSTLLRSVDIFSMNDRAAAEREANLIIELEAGNAGLISIDNIEKSIDAGYKSVMNNKEKILEIIKQPNRI